MAPAAVTDGPQNPRNSPQRPTGQRRGSDEGHREITQIGKMTGLHTSHDRSHRTDDKSLEVVTGNRDLVHRCRK